MVSPGPCSAPLKLLLLFKPKRFRTLDDRVSIIVSVYPISCKYLNKIVLITFGKKQEVCIKPYSLSSCLPCFQLKFVILDNGASLSAQTSGIGEYSSCALDEAEGNCISD